MEPELAGFVDELMTGTNMILGGAVYAITQTLKVAVPEMMKKKIAQRVLPTLPLVLAVGGSLLGLSSGETWQEDVAIGLIVGSIAAQTFKVGKTTFLGKGVDVEDKPKEEPKAEG